MNKLFVTLFFIVGSLTTLNGQAVVFNEKLLTQLTKNQTVRLASNEAFINSYEKQKKLYDDANNKLQQIIVIHQYIHSNLVNIQTGIKQGKKLFYLYQYFGKIGKNIEAVASLTLEFPQYSILLNRYYIGAVNELWEMQKQLREEILREDNDFLMDPFDREVVINNLFRKARLINGYFVVIKTRLSMAKRIPYIYQIPVIQTYVNLDKMIVKDIIKKYNYIFN